MIVPHHRYRVVFLGEFDHKKDMESIKAALIQRFKLKPAVFDRLLNHRPIVVKNNTDAETAFKYKQILDDLGAYSYIQEVPNEDDTDEQGYVERRKQEQRVTRDRRSHPREGAIQPDRRKVERRKNWSH